MIKLISTDLDGTLLDSNMNISENNLKALHRCVDEDIHIVVATGRSFHSVPIQVREIEGLEYLICANGAKIYDNISEELFYAEYLDCDALKKIWHIFDDMSIICEIFWDGKPYVSKQLFESPEEYGMPFRFREYFVNSRTPVDDIKKFTDERISEIENINFLFSDMQLRDSFAKYLADLNCFTLTSSFPFNLEIGGVGVNKAAALDKICKKLGVLPEEVMSFGDNANDITMIKYAGVGVAMENAVSEVKKAAVFVTRDRDDDGVAFAINLMLDGEND